MNQDKKLDRKDFLTSAVATWAAVSLGACSDEGDDGGTDDGTGGATGGSATGGSATGGSATGGSATGGSATGGSATGGSGGGGGGYTCTTNTMMVSSGNPHSHPLTIPGSDIVRGYQDAPYVLEDGGTGHTHTLELAAYEWAELAGGSMIEAPSSTDAGHSHDVTVICVAD
jgi:hypothetical protein